MSSTSASRKPERRRVPPGARLARAAVETNTLSRPGRALARRADGDVPFDDARTRDCLPSQLGRTTAARTVEPPIARARSRGRERGATVWPSIRYTTLRQAWPGTRGSPRPQCAFDWSMFV